MLAVSSKVFYVNTRYRLSGSSSSFTYEMKMPPENGFTHACMLDISIPKSYYLIDAPNNTFTLTEGKVDTIVTIPEGNYTVKNIISTLTTILNTASPNHWIYSVQYPSATQPDTGKFTFAVTGATADVAFTFPDSNVAEVLGFDRLSTNIFAAGTLVSANVIDLQRETTLYIHSNLVSSDSDNILQEVFATGDPDFARVVWKCTCEELSSKQLSSRAESNVYEFSLTDENGVPVDLHGQDFQMTICVYKKSTISIIVPQLAKLSILDSLSRPPA